LIDIHPAISCELCSGTHASTYLKSESCDTAGCRDLRHAETKRPGITLISDRPTFLTMGRIMRQCAPAQFIDPKF